MSEHIPVVSDGKSLPEFSAFDAYQNAVDAYQNAVDEFDKAVVESNKADRLFIDIAEAVAAVKGHPRADAEAVTIAMVYYEEAFARKLAAEAAFQVAAARKNEARKAKDAAQWARRGIRMRV